MEATGIDGNHDVRVKSAVIQLETEEEASTRKKQAAHAADNVLKSLSPLINSMRLFGLYFSREPCESPSATSQLSQEDVGKSHGWNSARIYATIILVVIWVNSVRFYPIFYGIDTLGVELLMKLALISSVLLLVVLHTAYYVASHSGSLDRVFRRVNLSAADIYPKYSRRAKILTFVCWTLIAFSGLCYIFPMLISWDYSDETLLIFINTFHISKPYAYVIVAIFIMLGIQHSASWVFPQATNSIIYSNQTLLRPFLVKVLIIIVHSAYFSLLH